MMIPVSILTGEVKTTVMVESGSSPFQAIRERVANFGHACGGNGTCGKCRVILEAPSAGAVSEPEESESVLLGRELIESGHRLACMMRVFAPVELKIEIRSTKAKISAESDFLMPAPLPSVEKSCLSVAVPSLSDQRSDWARLQACAFIPACLDAASLMRDLPAALRAENGKVTLVLHHDALAGIQAGDREHSLYGIACDIGTTTIAGCLFNLCTGEKLSTETLLNGQRKYGADVIARIHHTMEHKEGASQLRDTIVKDLTHLGVRLCERAGLTLEQVDEWVLTGNTTMGHLLMNWPAGAIAAAPFIPVSVTEFSVPVRHVGPFGAAHAVVTMLPGVSAYVGADTVSAVVACGIHQTEKNALVVDLGTNGELVLGSTGGMTACSTAAGPAFEGAGIRFGMGAVDGAIDGVFLSGPVSEPDTDLQLSVLGNRKPEGLCGTGLLDAIALLVRNGIVDETGRLQDAEDLPPSVPAALRARCTELDDQPAFLLASGNTTSHGQDILLTQRDIREFQNAKAAIAAGIETLADVAGVALADVEHVYLAGGLGTWLNPESAIETGLIPRILAGRIRSVGNAALAGASQCLLSTEVRATARQAAADIRFVELSGRRDFNDRYVDAMMFGEEC